MCNTEYMKDNSTICASSYHVFCVVGSFLKSFFKVFQFKSFKVFNVLKLLKTQVSTEQNEHLGNFSISFRLSLPPGALGSQS